MHGPSANHQPSMSPDAAADDDPGPEAVLHDPAALWEAVWQTTADYLVVVDRNGIIRDCNRVDEGFTLDQVVGHRFAQFSSPESASAVDAALQRVFDAGEMQSVETTVRQVDGGFSSFSLRFAPIRHEGRTVAALACCRNTRPLKDSEQALTRERNVLKRLLEIQERERQLVSYDIHDGLAQYLTGALMHLQAYEHAQPVGAVRDDFEQGMRLLAVAATEARRLISGLRPPALDELGIIAAIESMVSEARIEIPQITFTHDLPDDRLPPQFETIIFRIVQEALTNARKYAAARSAAVTLELVDDHVRVRVRDDGRGFDPAAVPEDRFGLEGIRQRCRLLGGEARIEAAPGIGTTIEAILPIAGKPGS